MRKLEITLITILLVIAFTGAVVSFSGKSYLYKTLLYQQPGIDDLEIFPHRTLPASRNRQPWPKADDYQKQQLSPDLRHVLEEFDSVAFLVVEQGQLRYEEYWDGYDPITNSNSFSVAKSIISILIGAALRDGAIDSLDDPISTYISTYREGRKANITIRHVLQMTSGLSFKEAYNKPVSDTTEAYYGTDLPKLINSLRVVEPPDSRFEYRSGDTQVLSMVLQGATGMKVSDYAALKLWQPLQAEQAAQWSLDWYDGSEKAYCCFYSNARDFARIGQLYLNGGEFAGNRIVDTDYVRLSTTPHSVPDSSGMPVDYYGYQWWIMQHDGMEIFYARGILGQYILVIPDRQIVVVRLGHRRGQKTAKNIPSDLPRMLDGLFETFNQPLSAPAQPSLMSAPTVPAPTEEPVIIEPEISEPITTTMPAAGIPAAEDPEYETSPPQPLVENGPSDLVPPPLEPQASENETTTPAASPQSPAAVAPPMAEPGLSPAPQEQSLPPNAAPPAESPNSPPASPLSTPATTAPGKDSRPPDAPAAPPPPASTPTREETVELLLI